jgi:hypothetical protein
MHTCIHAVVSVDIQTECGTFTPKTPFYYGHHLLSLHIQWTSGSKKECPLIALFLPEPSLDSLFTDYIV